MKKIFILLFSAVLISSCNLDIAPENEMVDEITYKDPKTAEAALLGAYTRLNSAYSGAPTGINNYANSGDMMIYGEIGTPTLISRTNSSYIHMETSQYNTSDHEGFIENMWRVTYNAIDYANNIISNIHKFGDYDSTLMAQHIAEAKFIRAYEYMLLLQAYGDGALTGNMKGLGVVLRLNPYDGYKPADIASRATVEESYDQILKDLTEALPYLPNGTASTLTSRTRASKVAAHALLSRVYLYRGSYSNDTHDMQLAADYADSVINNTKGFTFSTSSTHHTTWTFPLNPTDAETNTTNYSPEAILLAPCYSSVSKYANGVSYQYYNKSSFYIDPAFIALYESGDRRGYIDPATGTVSLIWQGSPTNFFSDFTTYKYNNGNGYNNVLYLRVSEAKLTKAEALARLNGINDESIKQLNDIRKKPFGTKPADYTGASFATAADLINTILTERMKELAFEGHTRFDLIRTNRPLRDASIPNNRKILPIPDYDIRISYGAILQNEGYR